MKECGSDDDGRRARYAHLAIPEASVLGRAEILALTSGLVAWVLVPNGCSYRCHLRHIGHRALWIVSNTSYHLVGHVEQDRINPTQQPPIGSVRECRVPSIYKRWKERGLLTAD